MRPKILVGVLVVGCIGSAWALVVGFLHLQRLYHSAGFLDTTEYSWLFRLLLNSAGYGTVLLPGFLIYKYLQKTSYFDRVSNTKGLVPRSLFVCFGEVGERLPDAARRGREGDADRVIPESLELAACFTGLMGAYLVWGLLQEKIMTQSYTGADGSQSKFHDSQFLVFVNRLSALLMALARLLCSGQPLHAAPLYKFSYCALSNVLSAWCQYEALKYVGFPTQVLSKACKVIPVMLMGKAVSGNKYEFYEYLTALLISVGMVLFMFGSNDDYTASTVTTLSGAVLLALYMLCDSFTSNWQGELFQRYTLTPVQMMLGVNVFSCLFTGISLAQQPHSWASLSFLREHPDCMTDCLLLSLSSALGQLVIYHTISRFGAVVFTIIMTLRQAVAILLSCLVYGHSISSGGVLGVVLVFVSVLLRIYCKRRLNAVKRRADI